MLRQTLLACSAVVAFAADGHLVYDGSSTVYPIVVAASEAYIEVDPRFSLEAKPTGSSAGFRSLLARSSTITGASRPINAKELKAANEARIDIVEVPLGYDALSVVCNPRNPWLKDLTVAEMQTAFAANGPASWKQVRASFPDAKITLYGPGTDSGTLDYFCEAVLGKDRRIRADYIASEDDHMLVQGVASEINAVGFFGMAYVAENAQTLRAVAIDNGKGAVLPNRQSVLDGSYMPLSRPLFLYLTTAQAARPEVAAFVSWLIEHPAIIESVGYVPLPAAMRAEIGARFAKRVTGSVFSGVAVGTTLNQAIGIEAAADEPRPPAKPVAAAAPVAAAPVAPAPKPAAAAKPAWNGPNAVQHQQDVERLRAAALDLARRSLDDAATIEELAQRSAELQQRVAALTEAFRTAPRSATGNLSLGEAAALAK